MFKFSPEEAAKIEAAFQKAYDKLVENCGKEKVEAFFGENKVDEVMEEVVLDWPKLCRHCKHSSVSSVYTGLSCTNPKVNAKDSWALASKHEYAGTECNSERKRTWFAPCGRKGKLWESKYVSK